MNSSFTSIFGPLDPDDFVSGLFSDELDRMGLRSQVVDGWVANRDRPRLFGRVRPMALEAVETADERIGVGLGFLAAQRPDDVLVVAGCSDFAYFGELMTRLSQRAGMAGVVIDGLTRDTHFTKTVDLPIFARGYTPRDIKGRGRVKHVDQPIVVGGVAVTKDDYVFADGDAVVFIPQSAMPELVRRILKALADEVEIKKIIAEGGSVEYILSRFNAF